MSFHQEADPYFEDEYEDSETYIELHSWEDDDCDESGDCDEEWEDWLDEEWEEDEDDELCPTCHCSKCECDQQPPSEPYIPDLNHIPF